MSDSQNQQWTETIESKHSLFDLNLKEVWRYQTGDVKLRRLLQALPEPRGKAGQRPQTRDAPDVWQGEQHERSRREPRRHERLRPSPVNASLTFDMSGGTRRAKPAVARPLDGWVRRADT